ncbi:hypothetical protein ACFQV2_20400 [Actinokineospora soli]|uniref:Uncharacterized protein n=1 Tax=Actinokineospora soli TaxID=1048753 RepID=A0ABW2TQ50_9PSEU
MNTPLLRERDASALLDEARTRITPVLRGVVEELPRPCGTSPATTSGGPTGRVCR